MRSSNWDSRCSMMMAKFASAIPCSNWMAKRFNSLTNVSGYPMTHRTIKAVAVTAHARAASHRNQSKLEAEAASR